MTGGARAPSETAREEPLDLRLLPPALTLWIGAYAGTGGVAVLCGALAAAAALGCAVGWRTRAWAVVAAALCLLAGLAVGALHLLVLAMGPVDDLAAARATASGTATVTADPRRVAPAVRGVRRTAPLVLVPVRLGTLTSRGHTYRVRSRVVILARASRWADLLPGQQVRWRGRLGPRKPGQPVSAALVARGPPQLIGRPPAVQRAAGTLRAGLREASAGLPRDEASLLPGLVLGDTSRVRAELTRDFRIAGLTHLTAVSGANLAIVTGFVMLAGRMAGLRGRALPLAAGVAMAGFVVLARPQPSVLRAAVMGAIALAALAGGRRRRSVAALGAATLLLLLVDPWLARSYGFTLSVLATGALVLLAPRWARSWRQRGVPTALAHVVAVPLAAQFACAPVVAMLSGQVSLVAVLANVLVVPVIAPATVLGVLATVASTAPGPLAAGLAHLAGWCVWWVVTVAERAASLPYAAFDWPSSVPGAAGLAGITAVLVYGVRHAFRRPRIGVGLLVLIAVAVGVPASRPGWPPRGWVMAACDVGQGDALVLAAGPGAAVVVDAGPDPPAVDRCLRRLGVRRIPAVVLTHLHADHVEGLPGVLEGRRVGEVVLGGYAEPTDELVRVTRWAAAAGVPLTRAVVGDRARIGTVSWQVVWPERVIGAGSVPNNASTVLVADVSGITVLLTGDIEREAQRALLVRGSLREADVLKVAHHGSANQELDLLAAVRPRIALVSVGADNDYGHPAPSTMRALRASRALVGRTDRDGTLVVVDRGGDLRLVTAGP